VNLQRSAFLKWATAGVIAAGALFAAASANAGTSWSVGINVPGVAGGVADPGPVSYEPAPPPVYYRPPPPVYRPAPVYYGPPAPVYYPGERWRGRHHHHRRDWDDRDD
jgi:hypothetical protein